MEKYKVIAYCLVVGYVFIIIFFVRTMIVAKKLFRYDDTNEYRRYCKKCGSCQELMSYSSETLHGSWWEERYPVGDNPNCECHSYSECGE